MTLDSQYQVPTVAVHTHVFEKVVRSVARVNGMPRARAAFVPQPVMGKSAGELRAYVDGNDPISGRPVMQEVIEGLTRPFDAQDQEKTVYERTIPRLVEPDTEDNLQRLFLDNNWTDKLPIILPTEERVAEMLAHTSTSPTRWSATCGRRCSAKRGNTRSRRWPPTRSWPGRGRSISR